MAQRPNPPAPATQDRDWYSISVASVRRTIFLFLFVLGLIGSGVIYQRLEASNLRDRAELAIADATQMVRQLEARDDYRKLKNENFAAWEALESARAEFAEQNYRPALDQARRSFEDLRRILQVERGEIDEGGGGKFTNVQGGVEYRLGDRGTWRRARQGDSISPGDWVKTSSDGSAEIRYPDGSTFVLRPNTMIHLESQSGRDGQNETELVFGWVELNTTQGSGKVTTPKSQAKVRSSSEALVSFDRKEGSGQFAAYKGGLDVASENGTTKSVKALQQVTQVGDLLMDPVALPDRPELLEPAHEGQVDFDTTRQLTLRWRSPARAARYSLMVSRSPLFASNVVARDDLTRSSARLRIQGEGVFYWQVSAISADGAQGPWSEPSLFRIASLGGQGNENDTTPPELEIERIQTFGKLVLVNGRAEKGSAVRVNGEPVTVQVDGTFNKTIEVNKVGFTFLEVVATDARQNPTEIKRRVFIDAF